MNDEELLVFLTQFRHVNTGHGLHVPVDAIAAELGLSDKMQGKLASFAGTLIEHRAAAGLVTAARRSGDPNLFVGRLVTVGRPSAERPPETS